MTTTRGTWRSGTSTSSPWSTCLWWSTPLSTSPYIGVSAQLSKLPSQNTYKCAKSIENVQTLKSPGDQIHHRLINKHMLLSLKLWLQWILSYLRIKLWSVWPHIKDKIWNLFKISWKHVGFTNLLSLWKFATFLMLMIHCEMSGKIIK